MKSYEELSAELDAATAGMTPDQLACDLAEHGMKFDNPSPAIQAAMDEFDAKNPPDDGWPTVCPCCGAEWEYRLTGGMGYKCNSTWIERTNETDRAGNCYERQISALLEDKPTAAEFEQVCTSNHQLERELAQLRHESGIKDGRIAELDEKLSALAWPMSFDAPKTELPCQGCGKPVVQFAVPSDLWNVTVRQRGRPDFLCISCFYDDVKARIAELEGRHEWACKNLAITQADYERERDRAKELEGVLAGAPHSEGCGTQFRETDFEFKEHCNCWKSKALNPNTNACLLKEESK